MPPKSNAKALASKNQQKDSNAKNAPATGGEPRNGHSKKTIQSAERLTPDVNTSKLTPHVDPESKKSNTHTSLPAQDHVSQEVGVNKKKQKRRMKEAAKKAAGQSPSADAKLVQRSLDDAYST